MVVSGTVVGGYSPKCWPTTPLTKTSNTYNSYNSTIDRPNFDFYTSKYC